jgi:hypothetical protein
MLAWTATLLVLLNTVVAVLVVDLACLLLNEDLVGFRYFNELLARFIVATETPLET